MGVNFVHLTDSTASDIFVNVGGHFQPPIILLEQVEGVKYTLSNKTVAIFGSFVLYAIYTVRTWELHLA